ncbi:hypothetical protein KIPB_004707 [Kipferlia bialata]|uniref:Uncharacterized protein n=1 Tax=Kipferlia bialata TaxID=797122 RepID=A0A9K3CW51_9EUKA|nr:hypothetical protein KIPB_004707 [Kipferlia bialata]|eukprot:g4707.t1
MSSDDGYEGDVEMEPEAYGDSHPVSPAVHTGGTPAIVLPERTGGAQAGMHITPQLRKLLDRTRDLAIPSFPASATPSPTPTKGAGSPVEPHRQTQESEYEEEEEESSEYEEAEEVKATRQERVERERESSEEEEGPAAFEDEEYDFSTQPRYLVSGTLRRYQLEGLQWLAGLYTRNINGILADEMGLGKTVQSISLLAWVKERYNVDGPHIVIVPKSTIPNWRSEFKRWCPFLDTHVLLGDKEERAEIIADVVKTRRFDVILTSYEIARIELSALRKIKWDVQIIDEGHKLKNDQAKISQVLRTMTCAHRFLLTGTPLQNDLHELWALLNYILPGAFPNAEEFTSIARVEDPKEAEAALAKLHRTLRPFILRREKKDVEALPPKRELVVMCGLSKVQQDLYKAILAKDLGQLAPGTMKGSAVSKTRLLNTLMQLRKVCNHPYLFPGVEAGPPYVEGEHLVDNCGKLLTLDCLLPRLYSQGSRVLIFSQMTRVLSLLEDYCRYRQYGYVRLDGSTSFEDRAHRIKKFNAKDSKVFIFLLSTRAGGLGINLATADTVVLYDSDWNPQQDLQAMDRAHRIGQKKPVNVYR